MILIFSYYWVTQCLRMCLHMVVSASVYTSFVSDPQPPFEFPVPPPRNPWGLLSVALQCFGSVAAGALMSLPTRVMWFCLHSARWAERVYMNNFNRQYQSVPSSGKFRIRFCYMNSSTGIARDRQYLKYLLCHAVTDCLTMIIRWKNGYRAQPNGQQSVVVSVLLLLSCSGYGEYYMFFPQIRGDARHSSS